MYSVFFSVVGNCFCHRFWCVRAIGFGFRLWMQLGLVLMRACNVKLVLVLVYNRLLFRCVRAIVFNFDFSLVLCAICLVVTGVFVRNMQLVLVCACNWFWFRCVHAIGFDFDACVQRAIGFGVWVRAIGFCFGVWV